MGRVSSDKSYPPIAIDNTLYYWDDDTKSYLPSSPIYYSSLADRPAASAFGVGQCQIGSTLYVSDGVSWSVLTSGAKARIPSIRPKIACFGNSLASLNQEAAGAWQATSPLFWIHAFSNDAFDRCRSAPFNWGTQGNGSNTETIDRFGTYGWGGALNTYSATHSMLIHMPQALQKLIDKPDVIYLCNMFENDISQSTPTATVIADGLKTVQLMMASYPNALIIIACPSPSASYTTAGQHTTFAAVTAWIKSLPAIYPNVVVETNTATTIQSGNFDQPITDYVYDGIHFNERGAFVRARAFWNELGYLFPNKQGVSTARYNSSVLAKQFQLNPDFSLIGAPGGDNGQFTGVVLDAQYTSYDWYLGAGYGVTGAKTSETGLKVTLTAIGATGSQDGAFITSDSGTLPAVKPFNSYKAAVRFRVINKTNLFGFYVQVTNSGGVGESHIGPQYQGIFKNTWPQGLSDLLQNGDEFTLTTPPLPPGSTNTSAYTQFALYGVAGIPVGAITANNPSVQILGINLIEVDNGSDPKTVTLATTVPYTNISEGVQQLVITGNATWTSQTITRGSTAVTLPSANGIITLAPGDIYTPTYSAGTPVFTIMQVT